MNINLASYVLRQARQRPHAPAVFRGAERFATFGELADRAARIGAFLRAADPAGRPVALFMRNCPEYFELLCGIWWSGRAAVPVNAKLHPRELAQVLEDARASVCFTSAEESPHVEEALATGVHPAHMVVVGSSCHAGILARQPMLLAEVEADAVAWIFFTSGTTGRSKGALLTHANLAAMCSAYVADLAAAVPEDRMLHLAPVSHGSGLYGLPILFAGGAQVVPRSGGFDAEEAFELLSHHRQCVSFLAPTMLRRLVERPAECERVAGNIKMIVYGGGPMYLADLKRALRLFGPRLAQIYGQGESPMTITALSSSAHWRGSELADDRVLSSVGSPRTGTQVRLAQREGLLEGGEHLGEILVKGPTVMKGYLGLAEATADTLQDGWLRTGDVGEFDGLGLLHLRDRSKDVVISGGSNIYPREVEEVLLEHDAIIEACAVGLPDPEWGEVLAVAYTTTDGHPVEPRTLDERVLSRLARFKRPKRYVHLAQLPKNHYGKILKREVRELLMPARAESQRA